MINLYVTNSEYIHSIIELTYVKTQEVKIVVVYANIHNYF